MEKEQLKELIINHVPVYYKIPSISSAEFSKLLEKGGAAFVRQRRTDYAIYARFIGGIRSE